MRNEFLQSAINSWISQAPSLNKYFNNNRFAKPFIEVANLVIESSEFWALHAEDFIDGLVFLKFGMAKSNEVYLNSADKCLEPVMNKVIERLMSVSFQKSVISRTVTGEEKLPIQVPEIYITVNELLALNRRLGRLILVDDDVDKLKQDLLHQKIKSWGLTDEGNHGFKLPLKLYYPNIFNPNGYLLFDYLMKEQKRSGRGVVTDINFFYLRMVSDGFIHAKEEEFKKWFNKNYPDFPILDRFHNMDRIKGSAQRVDRYKSGLANIKANTI